MRAVISIALVAIGTFLALYGHRRDYKAIGAIGLLGILTGVTGIAALEL